MPSGIYDVFKMDLMEKQVDLSTGGDTIQVALLDDNHTDASSDLYTDTVWGDVSGDEIAGAGYSAGGETLGSQTVAASSGTITFDGANTEWTSASFSAWNAVIYDQTNTSSLICTIDFGGEQQVTSGTFTIEWNAAGIISLAG